MTTIDFSNVRTTHFYSNTNYRSVTVEYMDGSKWFRGDMQHSDYQHLWLEFENRHEFERQLRVNNDGVSRTYIRK